VSTNIPVESEKKKFRTFLNELPFENIEGLGVGLDHLVHQRLGESRLVDFVVAESSVTNNIDHHVLKR
jgi:hypothetical protein